MIEGLIIDNPIFHQKQKNNVNLQHKRIVKLLNVKSSTRFVNTFLITKTCISVNLVYLYKLTFSTYLNWFRGKIERVFQSFWWAKAKLSGSCIKDYRDNKTRCNLSKINSNYYRIYTRFFHMIYCYVVLFYLNKPFCSALSIKWSCSIRDWVQLNTLEDEQRNMLAGGSII